MSAPSISSNGVPSVRRDDSRVRRMAMQVLFLLSLIAAWHALTHWGLVNALILPSPLAVFDEFRHLVVAPMFWHDVSITLVSIVVAYLIAAMAGILVGVLVGQNRFAYDVFNPILASLFSIPLIILYPLALYLAGVGPLSKIIFAATYGFFPIALSTMSGMRNIPGRFVRFIRTLGDDFWLELRKVYLPAALPEVLNGLRVSFVITFASVVAGEMIAAFSGLGRSISYNAEILELPRMYALIVAVVVFAGIINAAMSSLKTKAPK